MGRPTAQAGAGASGSSSGAEAPDEARTVRLAATGERWEAAAQSVRLALLGVPEVL